MARSNLLAVLAILVAVSSAAAQYGGMPLSPSEKGVIDGNGTVVFKRPATGMRMYIELTGKGKTLEEALKNLKDRRTAAVAQVEKLKAQKDSIKVENPEMSKLEAAKKQQFEALVARQMASRGGKTPKGLKVPESVAVSCMLSAEWPLDAKNPEETLLAVNTLQEKIKAAKIAGEKEEEEVSPEEQEMMEEMTRNNGREMPAQGTPNFVFFAKLTAEECVKAKAEAFAKAREEAAEAAEAAKVKLGALISLRADSSSDFSGMNDDMYDYNTRMYMQRRMSALSNNFDAKSREAMGMDPNALNFRFVVVTAFALENK